MAITIDITPKEGYLEKDAASFNEIIMDSSAVHQESISVQIQDLTINGFVSSKTGVANFLNVPYAHLPARFRQAVLVNPRKQKGAIDATKYGPCCPQPVDKVHFTTSHLYPKMIDVQHSAEFSCLSLNIYAPPTAMCSNTKLPVLAWIHGGAFTYGDAADQYDGNYIVQYSIAIGKPIVFVTMNYRLGYYGFMSSRELLDEARKNGEFGFANLGFHDQRIAFQWIQNNINFFGGDGFEVTASGESAGACSQIFHLRSNFPAFQRAFILSPVSVHPQSSEVAQDNFNSIVGRTGVTQDAPSGDKLGALRSLTATQIQESLRGEIARPNWDDEWFVDQNPSSALEDSRPFPSWIKGIVIGCTKEESSLFCPQWDFLTGSEGRKLIKQAFGDLANEILATYNIPDDDKIGSAADGLIQLTTNGMFGVASEIASFHTEVPVSLYKFEQIDTFKTSPYKGHAYHSLGNSMFFRLPTVAGEGADANMRKTSNAMCEAAITLAYGQQPWDSFTQSKEMMIFNGSSTGLRKVEDPRPWKNLISTSEKEKKFKAGCAMLVLDGMKKQQAGL